MPNAMTWVMGGLIYFALLSLVVIALGMDGLGNTDTLIKGGYTPNPVNPPNTSFWASIGDGLGTLFSFFAFDIVGLSDTLGDFYIPLKVIFVYLPLGLIFIAMLYSTAVSSGGG